MIRTAVSIMLLPSTPKQRQKEGSAWTVCVGLTVIEGAEIGHLVQKALLDEVVGLQPGCVVL